MFPSFAHTCIPPTPPFFSPQKTGGFDGVLGLAFDVLSSSGSTTVFHNLINQNEFLVEPVFAFYLPGNEAAELTIGGTDKNHYVGEIAYVPLVKPEYWEVTLDGLQVRK